MNTVVKIISEPKNANYDNASFMSIKISTYLLSKPILVCLLLLITFYQVEAQTDSINYRKTVPGQEAFLNKFEAYQASKNISGMQAIADRNHYPSPQKVLLWQKELQLNDRQKTALNAINKELQRKVNEMNGFMITNERTMDSLFRYKKVNNGIVIFYTNRYGLYQGELRNALLQACLKTEALLTESQIKKYDHLLQD